MRHTFALLSTLGFAAAQAVTSAIAPAASAPAGCSESYDGSFEITIQTASSKRDLTKRTSCAGTGTLVLSLADGILKDAKGRTAYVASNEQFQFDDPPQAGAIYTAGFSVCGDGAVALGGNKTWWSCESGTFSNLYDSNWAKQCKPVEMVAVPCGDSHPSGSVVATESVSTTIVQPISDGQPQVITTVVAVSEYSDGQPQVITATTPVVLSEYSDGQPQAVTATPTPALVSEYSDGQPQVTTTPTPALVSEYSDGQPQVTNTSTPALVSEYSDGQPQVVTTPTPVLVSQYSDGQPQVVTAPSGSVFSTAVVAAPTNGTTSPVPVPNGAAHAGGAVGAVVAGLIGAAFAL